MKLFRYFFVLATLMAVISCEKASTEDHKKDVEVTGIILSESSVTISVNEIKTLVATVSPADAADKTVSWSSDQPSIASVDDNDGKVRGISEGTAVITATAGKVCAKCTVTVTEPVLVVTGEATNITWGTASLSFGVNFDLAGKYSTFDAGIVIGKSQTITFGSDETYVIGRDKDGNPDKSGSYSIEVISLEESTPYYYQAFATFDGQTTFGEVRSFETSAINIANDKMVDLGLSVKWAGWNVGATRPEEFGDYFSWGEVQPKDSYWQETYRYGIINKYGWDDIIYKYNTDSNYGYVDNRNRLMAMDDAAYVNWGSEWRMPTDEEKTELLANTTHTKMEYNGVPGWIFTSKKNGVSIFFPATGVKYQQNASFIGEETAFWTSTLRTSDSRMAHIACNWIEGSTLLHEAGFEMDPTAESYHLSEFRYYGIPVRAVSGSDIPAEDYTLTTSSATEITPVSAKVHIDITPSASATEFGVLYTDNPLVALTPASAVSQSADAAGDVLLSGLSSGCEYYACAYATVNGKTYYGNVISFRTTSMVSLEVLDVENVTHESAKLNARIGDLTEIKASCSAVECGIVYESVYYGQRVIYPESEHTALTPAADGSVSLTVTGLAPYKTYFYKAYLKVGDTYYYSDDFKEFTTHEAPLAKWVDLGLSVLWATWDIGAESAEETGGKFAWGETVAKTDFTNYKWSAGGIFLSKYVTDTSYGPSDGLLTLLPEDDAATANWGDGARTPTAAEFSELLNTCTMTKESYGGRLRIKFTAPNGRYIYFTFGGCYWTSSLNAELNLYAYDVTMWTELAVKLQYSMRAEGDSHLGNGNYVRAVKSK